LLASEDLLIRATKTDGGYREGPRPEPERPSQRSHPILAITYDAKGQKQSIAYGNGTVTRYDYDPLTFRLRQLRTTRPGSDPRFPDHHSGLLDENVLQQLHYIYDPVGNITEIYDEAYEPVFFRNQMVKPRSRYTYDALYRLIEATGREQAAATGSPPQLQNTPDLMGSDAPGRGALRNYKQQYRYDAVGNIEQMQHTAAPTGSWTRRYTYPADSNRLLRTWERAEHWEDATATNKVTYRYDTHGSMLNLADVPTAYRLRWDYRDMIQSVNRGGGGWAYYNYDASKERTRKLITNEAGIKQWERFYLGSMEVYRRYNSGVLVEEIETHHLFVGEQRALIVEDVLATNNVSLGVGTRFRYQYSNHLGSACVELDESAAMITYEEYHPYGTSAYQAGRSAAEVSWKRYRYTGKELDEESGLYYHSARYYAPWLRRWISADPTGLKAGNNLYVYSYPNPVTFADRNGKWPSRADLAGLAEMGNTLLGYGEGLGQSAVSLVTGLGHMAAHPIETAEGIGYIATHRTETVQAIGTAAARAGHELMAAIDRGDTRAAGRMVGNVVGTIFVPAAGAKVAARLGQTARVAVVARWAAQAERAAAAATRVEQSAAVATRVETVAAAAPEVATPATAPTLRSIAATESETAAASASESTVIEGSGSAPRVAPNQSTVPLQTAGESNMRYGPRSHQELPRIISETNPTAAGRFNVAPGITGPDLPNPTGMNAMFAEMKSLWGRQSPMVSQARRWMGNPRYNPLAGDPALPGSPFDAQAGRYFFYDRRTGAVFEGIIQTEKFPSGAFRPGTRLLGE
jgi:RHS repeat-associated protein